MKRRGPKFYRSIEEFTREEIAPHMKAGWSLADLESDAEYKPARDDYFDEEPKELDFDFD